MMALLFSTVVQIQAAAGPIHVDGRLTEPAWEKAARISAFVEFSPGDNAEPPVATEAFLAYDRNNLYVAFRCQDPDPSAIRANLGDRDTIFGDDLVGIMVDTFHDRRRAFEFLSNPLGVQMDLLYGEGQSEDPSWDTLWNSAGRITPTGYEVEFAIPFKSLRFKDTPAQTWGIALFRDYPRRHRYKISSHPVDRNRDCLICQYDTLEGLEGIRPGHNLEFIPSLTSQRTDGREEPGLPMERGDAETEVSLSASWSPEPDMIVNGAFNPDFSQVEADTIQLDINKRFALFYPEKRPFFMEGSDFFGTPLRAVYTRSIADPDWGIKLTGKHGANAYGVLLAQDEVANFLLPANAYSMLAAWDHAVNAGVLRWRRDLGKDSTLGLLGTFREGGPYQSALAGVDGRVRVAENDFLIFQGLATDTRYPDLQEAGISEGESVDGLGYFVQYKHSSEHWEWEADYGALDEGFRADLGFIPRVDTRTAHADVGYSLYGDDNSFFAFVYPSAYVTQVWDTGGTATDHEVGTDVWMQLPLQTEVDVGFSRTMERYNEIEYRKNVPWCLVRIKPSRFFTATVQVTGGDEIDYENDRPGAHLNYTASVGFKPGAHVLWDGTAAQEKLWIPEGTVFTARLYLTRLYVHFSRKAFIRALFQVEDIRRDPDLYAYEVLERERTLSGQFLFSYRLNPFTLLYLGFSDGGYEDDATPRTTFSRSYFLKLSYALRP